jgi:hypothetical protein
LHHTREYKIRTEPKDNVFREIVFNLKMNATNQVSYDSHGKTWFDDGEVECKGVDWRSPSAGTTVDDVVEYRSDQLEMKEEEALLDGNDYLTLFEEQRRLPERCKVGAGHCKTSRGTWYWNQPQAKERCRLFTARKVTGTQTTVSDEGKAAIAFIDNEKMIRLVMRGTTQLCGKKVIKTNYKDLFLTTDLEDEILKRPIEPRDLNIVNYMNQQDAWLVGYLEKSMEQYTQRVLEAICEKERVQQTRQYAVLAASQQAMTNSGTVGLGDGRFATATGEAWHTYQCREMAVRAKDADRCFEGLPVALAPADREDSAEPRGVSSCGWTRHS